MNENLDKTKKSLDKLRKRNAKYPQLKEKDVENCIAKIFRLNLGYKNDVRLQYTNVRGSRPDIILNISPDFVLVVEVKKTGILAKFSSSEDKKSGEILLGKNDKKGQARYVHQNNAGKAGFGILTDSERWIIFHVEPVAGHYRVDVLLDFEFVTEETTMMLDKIKNKSPSSEECDYYEYQYEITKAVLPRLRKEEIRGFLEFLYVAHRNLKWSQFNSLMNSALPQRVAYFQRNFPDHWHEGNVMFIKAFYGNARFATGSAKRVIKTNPLILKNLELST